MRETWVRSLGWEDPLEEGMATHSSILAWRIPMDRGAWRAAVHEVAKSWPRLSDYTFLAFSFFLRVRPSLSPGGTHYGIVLKCGDEIRSSVISLLGDIHHRRSSVVRRIKWDKT